MRKVKLDPDERQRLAGVSREEKRQAFNATVKWVTGEMCRRGLSRKHGPLSQEAMGGDASKELAKIAYSKVFGGQVHWKPTCELTTQMIDIAYSEMGHIIRDYYRKGKDKETMMSQLSFKQQMDMELAQQVEADLQHRELGYDIARNAVKDKPKLLAYLEALYEEDDYRSIAKRLKISKPSVLELEKELLSILENS